MLPQQRGYKLAFVLVTGTFILFWIALLAMGRDEASGYPSALLAVVAFVQKYAPSSGFSCPGETAYRSLFRKAQPLNSEIDLSKAAMNNPNLISYIRKNYMEKPSGKPYGLSNPSAVHFAQYGQSQVVAHLFQSHNMTKPGYGTFFEAGAFDGETYSNSLYFEKSLNWSGVLVEPDPRNVALVRSKNRRATLLTSCISGPHPIRLTFACPFGTAACQVAGTVAPSNRSLSTAGEKSNQGSAISIGVWCFPLYSILVAAGYKDIDYMIIDLEGHEMTVLREFPFDKIKVKIIQLENGILDSGGGLDIANSAKRLQEFRTFFKQKWPNFKEYKALAIDVIFVNKDLMSV